MEAFTAGTLAGAGSFRCEECGFAVALHERDQMPACSNCGHGRFRRSALFEEYPAAPEPPPEDGPPEWLSDARDALVAPGDYLAFESADRVNVVPLQDGWTRIGRSLSAHVRFDDPTVSRRHALLYRDDDQARILDDRSLNGVFRNGHQVDLEELNDADEIAIGRFRLYFVSLAGQAEAVPESLGSAVG